MYDAGCLTLCMVEDEPRRPVLSFTEVLRSAGRRLLQGAAKSSMNEGCLYFGDPSGVLFEVNHPG